MDARDFLGQVFSMLWPATPVMLAATLGCVVALLNIRRAKRPAMFALCGFGLLLLSNMCSPVASTLILDSARSSRSSMAMMMGLSHLGSALVTAVALVLLMVAAFSGREAPENS